MKINYVENLSSFMDDKGLTSKTQNDLDYIREVRSSLDIGTGSHLLRDWHDRFDDSNIINAKRRVRKLDNSLHEGETIHNINPDRLDRASENMRRYCGLNPVTRKALLKQTLDLPHTDKLYIGRDRLSSNFKYREVVSGVSTHYTKGTTIYSDAKEYIVDEDKRVVLTAWERMLKNLKDK